MAKRLPPEELKRIRQGDFDPPPIPKGRPKKHENTRPVSFRLPEDSIKRLRIKAIMEGVTPADLLIKWIDTLEIKL